MQACGIGKPSWYRDATALYSPDALAQIREMGFRVGGFSLNSDFGASLPAEKVTERIVAAKDGDVIIGHINQPHRSSGAGLAAGVVALKAKGFSFVRLNDVVEVHAWGEGPAPAVSPAATRQTTGRAATAPAPHKPPTRPPAL
jgi:peptidoglycan/xylan/chitin deacetylase (PgdA/CDA1 family)